MKSLLKILILSILISVGACKKDKETKDAEGVLIYTGSLAADGCDWEMQTGNEWYHPDNLREADKKENAKIRVSYKLTAKRYHCGMVPVSAGNLGIPIINIKNINFMD
ncbi:hypothetical protein [Mucilaginibacter lacusdianchii]|uniref:hypothetical protein n=1 Tax=Mucilaginibacter lacusdianchii TaxID=2684211 RepID=UPI00131C3845|nr:hypothetical protein [Mucilaginibacter sp. JXJ CY 39]